MVQGRIFKKLIFVRNLFLFLGRIIEKGGIQEVNDNSQIIYSKESSEASEIETQNYERRVNSKQLMK